MSALSILLTLMFLTAPPSGGGAQAPVPVDGAAKNGPTQPGPVKITSKTFEMLNAKQQAIFKGNVVMKRDDMVVTCDTMTTDYDEHRQAKQMTCRGHVYLHQPAQLPQHEEREVWGDLAVFDNLTDILTVTGSPRAREGASKMKGTKVTYFKIEDRLHVDNADMEVQNKNQNQAQAQGKSSQSDGGKR